MSPERQVPKQYEARMIQLLRWRFEKLNLHVDDHQKVGELPLEIDMVVMITDSEWKPDFAKFPKIFGYFRQVLFACLGDKEKSPIVETIFDLYESEVRKIMLNIREESLKNILSVVPDEKIIAALGDAKIIAALGDEKIIAALGKERVLATLSKDDMIAALGGKEKLLRTLLAELDSKQLQKLLEEKRMN